MKRIFLPIFVATSIGMLSPIAFAQSEAAESAETALEEVLITGSRIKRVDVDGLGKVNVLTAEDFARIGAVAIDQVLKYSPFTAGASADTESNYLPD